MGHKSAGSLRDKNLWGSWGSAGALLSSDFWKVPPHLPRRNMWRALDSVPSFHLQGARAPLSGLVGWPEVLTFLSSGHFFPSGWEDPVVARRSLNHSSLASEVSSPVSVLPPGPLCIMALVIIVGLTGIIASSVVDLAVASLASSNSSAVNVGPFPASLWRSPRRLPGPGG